MPVYIQGFLDQYGYWALYALLAAGIVGVPVPDEILMTFIGGMTTIGVFTLPKALLVSFAGAMTGMIVSYALGRKVGKPFLWRYGRWVKLTPERLDKAEGWFKRYGIWTVCFGYFVPGIRHLSCYLAGVSGIRLWRYLLYAGGGALLWCAVFLTLGRFIGHSVDAIVFVLHRYLGPGLAVLGVLALVATAAVMRYRRNRAR